MKQIIILTLALLYLSGTKQTQAQTKEETIDWITEKIIKYGLPLGPIDEAGVSVTPCSIVIPLINVSDGDTITEQKVSFPVTAVSSVVNDKEGQNIIITLKSKSAFYEMTAYDFNVANHRETGRSDTNEVYITNSEVNLAQRMEKALKHLASFCEQKKEAF